ncbi:hypothetical protein [Oceanobacillus sp. J11TS1]|uniref:hypothetical protein n=1 Tax=Oceanobacillus sp. J11TS1 TaxID=2807191 RepID=UPI001B1A0B6A|nr:hypothetical protein [Oceanobacillus sp. J11TS1]GIO22093.1 hypothetical protein J11TS1_06740 [Oceanobacillus sp. J11TS1]
MLWLILLAMLIVGCYLIIKSQTRGYKILGYVLVVCVIVCAVVILSSIGVKTDNEIDDDSSSSDNPSMIVD